MADTRGTKNTLPDTFPLQTGASALALLALGGAAFFKHPAFFALAAVCLLAAGVFAAVQRSAIRNERAHSTRLAQTLERENNKKEALLADLVPVVSQLSAIDSCVAGVVGDARLPAQLPETATSPSDRLRVFADSFSAPNPETLEKLKQLADLDRAASLLQEMELRLPYIDEILRRVVAHTEHAAATLIERFGSIFEQTERADREAKNAIAALGAGNDGEDGLEALIRKSHESVVGRTAVINDFLRLNRENGDRVRKISDLVTKSEELISGIEDIAERSKLIAFNMAVESAKIGDKGRGFKVIVNELQHLNDQTTGFARDIMDIVKSFRSYNQELLDQWLVKAETLTDRVRGDTNQAELAVTALSRSYSVSGSLFRSLSESAIGVNKAMGDILESLQFQDITRQQIEGAASFIDEIGTSIRDLRTTFQTLGYSLGNARDIMRKIRDRHESQMKVSKDHDIFDLIERRST